MRRAFRSTLLGVALSLTASACANGSLNRGPESASARDASTGWSKSERSEPELAALYDPSGRPLHAPASYALDEPPADRWSVVSLGKESPPALPRPRHVGKRDISMRNARLDNALRYLASEGHFNLVVEGEMPTPVTIELDDVEPYDAAMALAAANNLSIDYQSGIMIVGKSTGKSSQD